MLNENLNPPNDPEEELRLSPIPTDSVDSVMDRWRAAAEQRKIETTTPTDAILEEMFEVVRKVFPQLVAYELLEPQPMMISKQEDDGFAFTWEYKDGEWKRQK